MFDFVSILFGMVNMKAAMIGVIAAQVWAYFCPSKNLADGTPATGTFFTIGGGWMARLIPIIAPVVACAVTIALEWDKNFIADDAARGVLSGFASEWMLRVYYKTIKGL
jgi:hypothetical protein